jgi:hypothetical protein
MRSRGVGNGKGRKQIGGSRISQVGERLRRDHGTESSHRPKGEVVGHFREKDAMSEEIMADLAWEIYEAYGVDTVKYCEGQAAEARARGDAGMEAYWGSMARLAADIRDPEAESGVIA